MVAKKETIEKVTELLDNIKWPTKNNKKTQYRSNITGSRVDKDIKAFTLGKTRSYSSKTLVNSANNRKFPELHKELKQLAKEGDPRKTYTSIQLNADVTTDFHRDSGNVGESLCIGLGDFKKGGLIVKDDATGKTKLLNNHNKFVKYDGRQLHKSAKHFGGTRYAVVFFNRR